MERQSGPQKGFTERTAHGKRTAVRPARRLLIKDLTIRDASFIAANMRDEDRREITCLWKDWDTRALGVCALETAVTGMVWSVWYDGQPAAAYGFSHVSAFDPDHWQAWAFGTDRFKRCVPLITRHLSSIRPIIERDCRRLQVISYREHDIAHGWIEALGGEREGLLRAYGRNGEDFFVYGWVRKNAAFGISSDLDHSA